MFNFHNILVYIDPTKESQPALERAVDFAKKDSKIKLTLFVCCYDLSFEMTSLSSSEEQQTMRSIVVKENQEWLNTLAAPYKEQGIHIATQVVWHHRPFQAAIIEILKNEYDLVIKSTHQHPKLSAILFTPTDWNLLRKCPVPVLLVKHPSWPENSNILCAIDCKSIQDDEHHELNAEILKEAQSIATTLNANMHLVNAYPTPPMNIMLELPEFDPINYENDLQKFHQKTLNEYAQSYNIPAPQVHLKQGLAEDVICEVANEIDAQLVILGSVGRTGLSATLLGHTAEQVIDNINCNLLALKPKGFISPITI
ncbi:universal stress protein UspE [Psychromonas sp. PT13]|uniref:universal stress protein UspE n=1 Tax=Psychromonas sp. PT13 TaxID=3439547 RepID=UPI003EBDA758